MIRPGTASNAAIFLFLLCCAAGAFFYAFISGLSFSAAAAAAAGAFALYAFAASSRCISSHRQHPVVSGEFSRALVIWLPAFIAAKGLALPAALIAAPVFILFEITIFSFRRAEDIFFPGIVSHFILCVLAFFVLSNDIIGSSAVLQMLTGAASSSIQLSLAAALLSCAVIMLVPRASHLLSHAAHEASPVLNLSSRALVLAARHLSLFVSFLLCGAAAVPFDLSSRHNPLISKASTFLLYLTITLSAASAAHAGYGMVVAASAAVLSYIRFFIISRRKSAHAERTRSFIHIKRGNRS